MKERARALWPGKRMFLAWVPVMVLGWANTGFGAITANPYRILLVPGESGASVLTTTTPDDPVPRRRARGKAARSIIGR